MTRVDKGDISGVETDVYCTQRLCVIPHDTAWIQLRVAWQSPV